jgi:hypothetical protein
MNPARLPAWFVVVALWLAAAAQAGAHRVDEYLQATRIAVGVERIDLEIDLTPGMSVASKVLGWIDTNADGQVSRIEGEAYAREMLRSVALSVDGRPVDITLVEAHVPEPRDMRLGTGTLQVRATAKVPAQWPGHHQVSYSNAHQPEASVYLVNALVPADSRIHIADQHRDTAQHGLTLGYTVTADARWASLLFGGLAMMGALGLSRLPRPKAFSA